MPDVECVALQSVCICDSKSACAFVVGFFFFKLKEGRDVVFSYSFAVALALIAPSPEKSRCSQSTFKPQFVHNSTVATPY